MSYEVLNINDYILHNYQFDDLTSLIDYITKTDFNKNWHGQYFSIATDARVVNNTGTNTFEEAVDLCLHGELAEYSRFINIKKNLEDLFPYNTQKRIIESSVYGFRPNISKFLTNSPNSMYKLVRKEENKFIDIYFNVANGGRVNSKEAIYNRGIFTILLIELLERNNYRVRLNFFELSYLKNTQNEIKEVYYCALNLKTPSQRLNSYIAMFPMCHASYLRRIMFALKERTDFKYPNEWSRNYGTYMNKEQFEKNFSTVLKIKENSIIIPSPVELGITGIDTIADLKSFFEKLNISNYFSDNQELYYDNNQKKFVLAKRK